MDVLLRNALLTASILLGTDIVDMFTVLASETSAFIYLKKVLALSAFLHYLAWNILTLNHYEDVYKTIRKRTLYTLSCVHWFVAIVLCCVYDYSSKHLSHPV